MPCLTTEPLRLVIFDCDGVLIDSELLSAKVVAEEISRLGWAMSPAESMARFVGYRMADIPPVVEAELGHAVPEGWVEQVRGRMIEAFDEVETIPGAAATLEAVTAMGLPFRVASNSAHEEMTKKFAVTGLDRLVGTRRHSARDVARGKPAPDVFLAAAAAEGIAPAACLVVEDSLPGIAAALAAGMAVVGLETHDNAATLLAAGAHPIASLAELPALLEAAKLQAAGLQPAGRG